MTRTAFCLKITRMGSGGWDRSSAWILSHKAAVFVRRQMRLVAEMGLLALHCDACVRIARVYAAASLGRTLGRSLNQRRLHERAALHREAERVELSVRLRQQRRRKAALLIV
jgi:hypothetical protein